MEGANKNYHGKTHKQKDKFAFKFIFPFNLLLVEQIVIVHYTQSCFLLSYISVISSMFTNKFVKKCQYYYTLLEQSVPLVTVTLYNVILRIARNLLETRENVKILTHPVYLTNLDWLSWEWSKKKNSKWPIFQNGRFSKSPILKIFLRKFHRLVLGLVGLIDAKGIDVAQSIWSWGCLT